MFFYFMKEKWLPLPENPSYVISSFGRVKSYTRSEKGRIIKGSLTHNGYRRICVELETGELKYYLIQRLVCRLFNGGEGEIVRHLDGCKTHNHYMNLKWTKGEVKKKKKVLLDPVLHDMDLLIYDGLDVQQIQIVLYRKHKIEVPYSKIRNRIVRYKKRIGSGKKIITPHVRA